MRKSLKLILLFCLILQSVFGQTNNLILTREQNNKWIDSIKTMPLVQQLSIIKDRLLADTNIFVKQLHSDKIKVSEQVKNKVYGDGKPIIIINGNFMAIDNKTETEKIIRLTQLLNATHIKTTSILSGNEPSTTAIYGSLASSGVILMTLTKKRYLRKFQKLNLKSNY